MNAAKPTVTVALCTWNGARFLEQQVDSVLAQDDVVFDVIAVDDASDDDCADILRRFALRDARIHVEVHDRNRGATASFEHAMSLARGDLIAPCDQDDVWHPRKLATLVSALGDADLAYCDSDLLDAEGGRVGRTIASGRPMFRGRGCLPLLFENSISGHAMLVRRSLFELARPFPDGVFHDWWLALWAATRGGVAYVDEPLVGFRRHANTTSGIESKRRDGGWLAMRRTLIHAFAQRIDGPDAVAVRELDEALGGTSGVTDAPALRRWLWRHRRALPGGSLMAGLGSLPIQLKLLRHARRTRQPLPG